MSVDIDLNREWKPGLQLDVDETELAIHKVVVQEQTLPSGRSDERLSFFKPERKRATGFQYGKNTDQPILDLVPCRNFLGQLFFSDLFLKILKWPSLLLGNIDGMLFDPFGVLKEKPFQFS